MIPQKNPLNMSGVSTDASKCMLSDGVTSVETALTATSGTFSVESGVTKTQEVLLKQGRLVQFTCQLNKATKWTTTGWNTLGTLPAGYRPFDYALPLLLDDTNGVSCPGRINPTTGAVEAYIASRNVNSARIYINTSFATPS